MIAVDTSALLAIVLDEPQADACRAVLLEADRIIISAGTLAEALIVAGRRNHGAEMAALVDGLRMEVAPVTEATTDQVAQAHARWGRGAGTAGLNFGDCFAYVTAAEARCPLLFVGNDFTRSDAISALARGIPGMQEA